MKYLRLLVLIIPLGFCLLAYFYKDSFYLFLAGITLVFALFIILPKFLSSKRISFSLSRKHIQETHHEASFNAEAVFKESLKRHEILIFMLISVLIFVIFFTYFATHLLQVVPNVKNPILEYYVSQFSSLKQMWLYPVVLLIVMTWLGPYIKPRGKNGKFTFRFSSSFFIKHLMFASCALLVAFVISFLTTYLYGIAQLNIAVLELKSSPNSVGVIYGKNAINSKLKSMTTVPQVIGSDSNASNTILSAVVNNGSNKNSYYQNRILKTLPRFLVISFDLGNQPVVMVNNTLIIVSIDKDTMQSISPALAHLLLKNYFKNHDFKGDPTITILNRQEYLAYRQADIDKRIAAINAEIQKIDDGINGLYGEISTAKQKIAANQSAIQTASSQRDYYYNQCNSNNSAGYYFYGVFYNTYIHEDCNANKSQWDQTIAQYQQNISDWNGTLQYDENLLSAAQTVEQNLKDAAQSVDAEKYSAPDELGVFEGPSHVRVVLDSTSPRAIDAFLETLVHENLHYQSYIAENRKFQFSDGTYDGFWEEGLTEYFARKVIAADLGVNTNLGYPLIVKIVAQIAKKIPESELQNIYFAKNDSLLVSDLNSAYGNSFYKNTEPYFEYLSVLPDDRQLKIANNIMTVIGAKQLTSSDLYSDPQTQ